MRRPYSAESSVNAEAPAFARGVRLRVEDGDVAYLLVPEGVVELNVPARATLELVDGKRGVDDIAAVLCERFDAPLDDVRNDVRELVRSLRERGFLT